MTNEELQQIFDRDRELKNQVEQSAAMPAERMPTPAEGLRGMARDLEPTLNLPKNCRPSEKRKLQIKKKVSSLKLVKQLSL